MSIISCLNISDCIAIFVVIVSIVTLIVTLRIARIIPDKDKLSHRKQVREVVNRLTAEMKSGRNHMCKIIDIDRLDTLYPDNFNSRNRQSYFKAELDGNDIHGVAFTDAILGTNKGKKDCFVVTKGDDYSHKVARGGIIPYDWIIDIDEDGDESDTGAIFFCKFKKRKWRYGYYCVSSKDSYSLKDRNGYYRARKPFKSYHYTLIEENEPVIPNIVKLKMTKMPFNTLAKPSLY